MTPIDRRGVIIVVLVSGVLIALLSTPWRSATGGGSGVVGGAAMSSTVPVAASLPPDAVRATTAPLTSEPVADLVGDEPGTVTSCLLQAESIRAGDAGPDVECLQRTLIAGGRLSGEPTGQFDGATEAVVEAWQTERKLFVDGVVGRETALSLGIWPDESLAVVRTPPPAEGAVDLMGYPLSSVATTGPDAPPLPNNSGSGRRLVYERAGQRVWAVDDTETVIRSWLISGSKYDNEQPGTHEVYSRSDMSTAWNGQAWLPKMVRWLKTDIGAIGFHALPTRVDDGSSYQTEEELGTRLSSGCQRQADRDADFTWDFAQIGTTVVVV